MHLRPSARLRPAVTATVLAGLASLVAPAAALAQNAYITNSVSNTVSVIDTATNSYVGSPINVGTEPLRRRGHAGRQQGLCRQRG
jgi:YVTN family beta-propeller protein